MKKLFTILAMVLATILINSCSEDAPTQPEIEQTSLTFNYNNVNNATVYIHIWRYDKDNWVEGTKMIFTSKPKEVFEKLMLIPTGYTLHIGLTYRDDRVMDEMLFNNIYKVKMTGKTQTYNL